MFPTVSSGGQRGLFVLWLSLEEKQVVHRAQLVNDYGKILCDVHPDFHRFGLDWSTLCQWRYIRSNESSPSLSPSCFRCHCDLLGLGGLQAPLQVPARRRGDRRVVQTGCEDLQVWAGRRRRWRQQQRGARGAGAVRRAYLYVPGSGVPRERHAGPQEEQPQGQGPLQVPRENIERRTQRKRHPEGGRWVQKKTKLHNVISNKYSNQHENIFNGHWNKLFIPWSNMTPRFNNNPVYYGDLISIN